MPKLGPGDYKRSLKKIQHCSNSSFLHICLYFNTNDLF